MRVLAIGLLAFSLQSCLNLKEYGKKILQESINKKYLKAHNSIREKAGMLPLVWDSKLELSAHKKASEYKESCWLGELPILGFNSYQSWGKNIEMPQAIVDHWHDGDGSESFRVSSKYTTAVGCSSVVCDDHTHSSSIIHICDYEIVPIWERFK